MLENTEEESMADFSIKSTAKGEIEFQEICPEGRFVKLFNKGNKVSLYYTDNFVSTKIWKW